MGAEDGLSENLTYIYFLIRTKQDVAKEVKRPDAIYIKSAHSGGGRLGEDWLKSLLTC
jgi:hypothetical protein